MAARRKWSEKQRRAIYLQHRRDRTHTDIAAMCKRGLAGLDPFEIPRRTITSICATMDRQHGEKSVEELERVVTTCTCEEPAPDYPWPAGSDDVPCTSCGKPLSIFHRITLGSKLDQERGPATPTPVDEDAAREQSTAAEEVEHERAAPAPDDPLTAALKAHDKDAVRRALEVETRSTTSPTT